MDQDLSPYLVTLSQGDQLFKEGDSGEEMYFIHSGKVRIEKQLGESNETLAVLEKGDFFGEMSLLDRVPRTATAVVEEDAELLKVDAANFQKLLQGNIEIAVRIIRKYTARLRDANDKLQTLVQDRSEVDRELQEILKTAKETTKSEAKAQPLVELAAFVGESSEIGNVFVMKPSILIGRQDPVTNLHPDIDLTLADKDRSVSRRHARLDFADGIFLLTEEIGVSNGTFVNKKKIEAGAGIPLKDGDRVTFGKVTFRFQIKN